MARHVASWTFQLLLVLGVVVAALFVAFVWPTRYRYETARTGENAFTIRVDRFSDKTWMLIPGAGWIPQRTTTKNPEQLPTIDGIGGRCSLDELSGRITCDISNNTDYTIESLEVSFKTSDGQITSTTTPEGRRIFVGTSCTAALKGAVGPHTMDTMSVTPPCGHDLKANTWTWNVVKAYGLAE
jgi:hypothetical protein